MRIIRTIIVSMSIAMLAFTLSCSSDKEEENASRCPNAVTSERSVSCGGQTYRTVQIGTQTWMAENLNYIASDSKCFADDPAYCNIYGRLYNWETAKNSCPDGWHLPSQAEWETLINYAIDIGIETQEYLSAGEYLKAANRWNTGNGNDRLTFTALPGGSGKADGSFNSGTGDAGDSGYWWTATDSGGIGPANIFMNYSDIVTVMYNDKSNLYSVRCIKD